MGEKTMSSYSPLVTFRLERHLSPNILGHSYLSRMYHGFAWAGVTLGNLTVRLWWVGSGSTFRMGAGVMGVFKNHRHLSIGKYALVHHVLYLSVHSVHYVLDNIKWGVWLRIFRFEIDITLYRINPRIARPDLWVRKP